MALFLIGGKEMRGVHAEIREHVEFIGSQLLVLQPRGDMNRLAVLTGGGVVLTGSDLLPSQPGAYAELQRALQDATAVPPHMTW